MPVLPSFLRGTKGGIGQTDHREHNDTQHDIGNDGNENDAQQNQAKRHFFRSLLKRSSSDSRRDRQSLDFATSGNLQPLPKVPGIPASRVPNPRRLFPLLTPSGTARGSPANGQPKDLQVTDSPLTMPELQGLFSGAPQFFAFSEGHRTGAPHPSAVFPWDLDVEVTDLCDHLQIHDEAWASITACPHITRDIQRQLKSKNEHHEKQGAHFAPRCRERPNMLSMQGIERGTMGYAAALELGVADALHKPKSLLDGYLLEHRIRLLSGKGRLRPLTESGLAERLINSNVTYHDDHWKHPRTTAELSADLFTQILFPPCEVADSNDSYSLEVQIEALVEVLTAPVWIDFRIVEWRVTLGQVLWEHPIGSNFDDGVIIKDGVVEQPGSRKFWLLLQILLSCELLLRLDAISTNIEVGLEKARPSQIKHLDQSATMSVRWSLILARSWLDNVRLGRKSPESISTQNASPINHLQIQGRHQARQLSGLVHFARRLKWPNTEELTARIANNEIATSDSLWSSTTAGTSPSVSAQHTEFVFTARGQGTQKSLPESGVATVILQPSGWLSSSYVSGLILPGEGLSHFLISTLLENDEAALSTLGREASLYSGFSYSGRSFWSSACVVGRVLAAGKGASECVGWISSDIIPRGVGDAWVHIDVEPVPEIATYICQKKPRIWDKMAIEHDGSVIGGAHSASVLHSDFILPSDSSTQLAFSIKFESLYLFSVSDTAKTPPKRGTSSALGDSCVDSAIQTYSAVMKFSIDADEEEQKEISIPLQYDIHFLTAHPCIFPQQTGGHHLHLAFSFTKASLFSLLSSSPALSFDSLLSPVTSPLNTYHSTTHTTSSTIPRVLVIDCTDVSMTAFPVRPSPSPQTPHPHRRKFGSDMEMLARALCGERGWNALISRRGRGCLACAIREAGALGWRVVLRFA